MKARSRKDVPVRFVALLAAMVWALGLAVMAIGQSPPAASAHSTASGAPPVDAKPLEVARLNAAGKLLKPEDLHSWVFLGTSLGMGYNPGSFNASHPGQFQVVTMEPNAYRYFVEHGHYAPGYERN